MLSPQVAASSCTSTLAQALAESSVGEQISALLAVESACIASSLYYARLGRLELEQGQVSDAVLHLEKSLMLDATNGEALIDYAEALYRSGLIDLALSVNLSIGRQANLPPSVRALVSLRQKRWSGLLRQQRQSLFGVLGYSSNLNNGSERDTLQLTFGDDRLTLPLEAVYRSKAGAYTLLGYINDTVIRFLGNEAGLSSYLVVKETQANIADQLTLGATIKPSVSDSFAPELGARVQVQEEQESLAVNVQLPLLEKGAGSDVNLSALTEFTASRGAAADRAYALGLRLGNHWIFDKSKVSVDLAFTRDYTLTPRVGGDQTELSASLSWVTKLAKGELTLGFDGLYLQDAEGSSDFLANNEPRHLVRTSPWIGYQYPLAEGLMVSGSIRNQYQSSNIDLFASQAFQFRLGLQYSW